MKNILFLILVVLSSSSIAADKASDVDGASHPIVSIETQSHIDPSAYYDDEKNLAKLAEKISSINKEKRDAIEILETVDSFYSKSFNTLLLLIISIIGIVGVIIPLVIAGYQNKLIKKQTVNLQESIDNEVETKLLELKKSLYADNEQKMLDLERDVKKIIDAMEGEYKAGIKNLRAEALARINHNSASNYLQRKSYRLSAEYYFIAGILYIQYKDHFNLRRVLKTLIDSVINKLPPNSKTESFEKIYNNFLKKISVFNTESIYSDDIKKLKSVWNDFEKRAEAEKGNKKE